MLSFKAKGKTTNVYSQPVKAKRLSTKKSSDEWKVANYSSSGYMDSANSRAYILKNEKVIPGSSNGYIDSANSRDNLTEEDNKKIIVALYEINDYLSNPLVTKEDVKSITEILKGLNDKQANEVIKRLKKSGKLDKLAEEIVDDGNVFGPIGFDKLGGLDKQDRREFYNYLASTLDAEALKEIFDSFDKTDNGFDKTDYGFEGRSGSEGLDLIDSIDKHAPDKVKQEFAQQLADDIKKNKDLLELLGCHKYSERKVFNFLAANLDGKSLASFQGELVIVDVAPQFVDAIAEHASAEARLEYIEVLANENSKDYSAMARVLASFKDEELEYAKQALKMLCNKGLIKPFMTTLATVPNSIVIDKSGKISKRPTICFILDLTSKCDDADMKAKVFNAGAYTLSLHVAYNAKFYKESVTESLAKIIDSDTCGVMLEMEMTATEDGMNTGENFTYYVKQMWHDKKEEQLKEQLGKLFCGNDMKENPYDYIQDFYYNKKGGEVYKNAEVLGYFLGCLNAASVSIKADENKADDFTENTINKAAGSIPYYWNIQPWIVDLLKLDNQGDSLIDKAKEIEQHSMPYDQETGEIEIASVALNAIERKYNKIDRYINGKN